MEWISVKDRMPNDGESVFASVDLKYRIIVGVFFHHEHPLHSKQWISEAQPGYDYGYENVTHWMPLPQPPKL